jgi:primary-amine oxidase
MIAFAPHQSARRLARAVGLLAVSLAPVCLLPAQTPVHPLDQLSAREHWDIYDALQSSGKLDSTFRILFEGLKEPAKNDVLAWRTGQPLKREATVHLTQGKFGYEAVVDVTNKKLVTWTQLPGKQYMTSAAEGDASEGIAMKDPRVKEALRKRGVTDFTHIGCGPANNGYFDLPEERNVRVLHVTCGDERGRISGYGESFDGLVVVVDMTNEKVLRIVDNASARSGLPDGHSPEEIGPTRAAVNPVEMVQPKGASYTLNGHEVSWQNWKFQFRMDMRRGLVLSRVRYVDGGKERSVMYDGSLSELFVPYMDPNDPWNYQGYFDLGTYPSSFGGIASSLEPGVECPLYASYFHSYVVTNKGAPRERQRTSCLFERGGSDVAWRHTRGGGGINEARPRTDLVLRMYMNAGNYDYLFDWVFQQDGSITVNLGATGMDQVKAASGTPKDNDFGRLIASKLIGVNHSHFFSFRLDMDVDGTSNSLMVDQLKTTMLPANNPRRSIWTVNTQTAATEKDGMRMSPMSAPEVWRIVNPAEKNAFGWPVGYEIEAHGAMSLLSPDDYMTKRARFIDHTLWVTPYAANELFAAGDYPTNSVAGDGLPKWTAANRSIAKTDVVTWVSLGFHHVPRPEDWPVMPVAWHSFSIKPVGFFNRSPAIDIPKIR